MPATIANAAGAAQIKHAPRPARQRVKKRVVIHRATLYVQNKSAA